MSTPHPWPAGAVTGLGSLPGTDPGETARLVAGELPEFPHLAELPGRGAGAEMIGRAGALLVDMPVQIVASGWRIAGRPGRDERRARDYLAWDLDALEAAAGDHAGAVKVQVAGPWTLAAALELPSGNAVLSDHGAVRDLADSLAEGVREHLAEVRRRVPAGRVVLQLDEPSLPAVLAGRIPTASGYGTLRAVPPPVAAQHLTAVLDVAGAGARAVHCCAPDVPVALLREAGVDAVSLDASLLDAAALDSLGEAVDGGTSLWLGVVPSTGEASLDAARDRLFRLWDTLGFPRRALARSVVPTPTCGLAGASVAAARRTLRVLRDVGAAVRDEQSA